MGVNPFACRVEAKTNVVCFSMSQILFREIFGFLTLVLRVTYSKLPRTIIGPSISASRPLAEVISYIVFELLVSRMWFRRGVVDCFALIVDQHQVTKLSVYKQLGAPISPVARTVRDTHGLPTRCCYIRLHNRPVDPLCLSAHSPRTRTHARSLACTTAPTSTAVVLQVRSPVVVGEH